jgi:PAS domain S-box-containing protein
VIKQPDKKLRTLRSQRNNAIVELEKYKLLVDSVQDYAIFLMDETGHILTWNPGAEKFKGYKSEEIIGEHFSTFYMPKDIAANKPEKELEIATKFGRVEDEDWRVRKDGTYFWASVVITALHDADGQLIGFAKVTRDLTERKRYEDELRKANTLLKAQQHELKLLNQSKDDFISLASHQLRTPATAIKQLLGLFVEGFQTNVSETHMNIIKKAYESNERQIDIVNRLLQMAHVDSGKVKLHLDKCDARLLLQEILEDFSDTFKERSQSVELVAKAATPSVNADAQHLRMAFENLVSNASKYTYPHGSITVTVSRAKGEVKIAVADNGVGIAKQDITALFGKFKRLPNDLSDKVSGTGLGLYWANKIITLHGGRIEVESELNEGSTFNVYLPKGK